MTAEDSKQPPWYKRAIGAFCGAIFGLLVVVVSVAFIQPTMLTGIVIGVIGVSAGVLLGIVCPDIAIGFTYLLELFG